MNLHEVDPTTLRSMPKEDLRFLANEYVRAYRKDKQERALRYYVPAGVPGTDGYRARLAVHESTARVVGIGGGNGSAKTETALVEMLIGATGVVPESLRGAFDPAKKMRGPIQCRVVCESLTTTLHNVILRKLKWWEWTGIDEPGGRRGHYGWIPKSHLKDGRWERSWSEKLRTLTFRYRDWRTGELNGWSSIQFCSHDQDASDFASGDFHFILEDEPPNRAIWTENEARTMRVAGRHFVAMTWPDDPAINVDWLFDQVYDPATPGPNKHPDIDWFNLYTTDNPNLDQESIAAQAEKWSEETRKVRIFGQPIRFSNRIHPLFTDQSQWWCYACRKSILPVDGRCGCGSGMIGQYIHVRHLESEPWPCVWLLDPHPRKPHMFLWAQVTPSDDLRVVADGEVDGDPRDVRDYVEAVERERGLRTTRRIIDPNMGRSPSGARRGITWQDEFDAVGLHTDLADDSDVGRARLNQYLEPDERTMAPRIVVDAGCAKTIYQMKRYMWDDHRKALDKDMKQKAKQKFDDMPTLLKYLLNTDPSFAFVRDGAAVLRRRRAA